MQVRTTVVVELFLAYLSRARQARSVGVTVPAGAISLIFVLLVVSAFGIYVGLAANNSSQSITTVCVVPVGGAGVYVHLVHDLNLNITGYPSGVILSATPAAYSCNGLSIPATTKVETNSSGWAALEGIAANYYYQIELNYQGRSYSFTLLQGPLDITIGTLSLPSGSLSVVLCYTLDLPYSCGPFNNMTITS